MQDNWIHHPDIQRILAYVLWYRRQHPHIQVTTGRKSEGSCMAFGEFHNLLYRQLVVTVQFRDGWLELQGSEEVVRGVLSQIASDIIHFHNKGQEVSIPKWDEQTTERVAAA